MPTRSARHAILSETATFDAKSGDLRVVIETPKGSRNKYDYDPDCDCMELGTVLPEGMSFPYDFGFVPSTLGDDGDPLDILVLMDAPVIPGCVIRARPIGAIEAKQKAKGEDWERNDRLIAIAVHAQTHDNAHRLPTCGRTWSTRSRNSSSTTTRYAAENSSRLRSPVSARRKSSLKPASRHLRNSTVGESSRRS
jgi:inorganic pyrophosphatase